jgi:hypothetical protein
MKLLQLILLTIIQLPKNIANAIRYRNQRAIANELEVARLDRIRNPENYRGK